MPEVTSGLVLAVPATPAVGEAAAVLAAGSRSFHFASLFLPADRRADAALLYAFCRHVDDVADDAADAGSAAVALDRLVAELTGAAPARPLVSALRDLFERRRIDVRYALELVAGVASDLGEVRVADDAALVRYGYRVAGTVGLMMVGVLGVRAAEALPHAVDLGVAMQLTNICRDVREDAERGRVYLPASRLRALGVAPTPEGVLGARDAVRRVVTDLLALADRYYASAEDGMRHIPWRARLAILVASSVYRAIGVRLLSRGADALAGRTVVPFGGKLWAAVGAVLRLPWASLRRSPHAEALHGALVGLPGIDPGVGPA